jgi:hypothetical protein
MRIKENENKPETESDKPALIIKSGDTDLRRGPKALSKQIETTGNNPRDGNMYGFSNMKDTIKIIQHKKDGDEMLVKKMLVPINNWPEYQPPDKPGYIVTLTGKEKDRFLDEIGCPKTL